MHHYLCYVPWASGTSPRNYHRSAITVKQDLSKINTGRKAHVDGTYEAHDHRDREVDQSKWTAGIGLTLNTFEGFSRLSFSFSFPFSLTLSEVVVPPTEV
jgi:hypothetical protein